MRLNGAANGATSGRKRSQSFELMLLVALRAEEQGMKEVFLGWKGKVLEGREQYLRDSEINMREVLQSARERSADMFRNARERSKGLTSAFLTWRCATQSIVASRAQAEGMQRQLLERNWKQLEEEQSRFRDQVVHERALLEEKEKRMEEREWAAQEQLSHDRASLRRAEEHFRSEKAAQDAQEADALTLLREEAQEVMAQREAQLEEEALDIVTQLDVEKAELQRQLRTLEDDVESRQHQLDQAHETHIAELEHKVRSLEAQFAAEKARQEAVQKAEDVVRTAQMEAEDRCALARRDADAEIRRNYDAAQEVAHANVRRLEDEKARLEREMDNLQKMAESRRRDSETVRMDLEKLLREERRRREAEEETSRRHLRAKESLEQELVQCCWEAKENAAAKEVENAAKEAKVRQALETKIAETVGQSEKFYMEAEEQKREVERLGQKLEDEAVRAFGQIQVLQDRIAQEHSIAEEAATRGMKSLETVMQRLEVVHDRWKSEMQRRFRLTNVYMMKDCMHSWHFVICGQKQLSAEARRCCDRFLRTRRLRLLVCVFAHWQCKAMLRRHARAETKRWAFLLEQKEEEAFRWKHEAERAERHVLNLEEELRRAQKSSIGLGQLRRELQALAEVSPRVPRIAKMEENNSKSAEGSRPIRIEQVAQEKQSGQNLPHSSTTRPSASWSEAHAEAERWIQGLRERGKGGPKGGSGGGFPG